MKKKKFYLNEPQLALFGYTQLTDAIAMLDNILASRRSDLDSQKKRCTFFFDKYSNSSYSHLLNKTRDEKPLSLAKKVYLMAAKLSGEIYEIKGVLFFETPPDETDATASPWYRTEGSGIKYFVYYYVTNIRSFPFSVHKAVVAINLKDKTNEVNLIYYWRRGRDDNSRPVPIPPIADNPIAAYRGTITEFRERLCLHFTSRKDQGREAEERMSMMWLNTNELDLLHTRKKVIATYVSFDPACGIGILAPGSFAEVLEEIKSSSISPIFEKYLIGRKVSLKGSGNTMLDFNHQDDILSVLDKYNAVYLGYVMSTKKGRTFIDTIKVQISKGYLIKLTSIENSEELEGYIINYSKGSMSCFLGFNYETEIYSTNLTLKIPTDTHEMPLGTLCGIYGGLRTIDSSPKVGRLILCPAEPSVKYEQITPQRIDLQDTNEALRFFKGKSFIIKYFASDYDKYVDAPKAIASDGFRKLYEKTSGIKEEFDDEISDFTGLYLSYCLSSDGFVYQLPIRINPTGDITRLYFGGPKETRIKAFAGTAKIYHSSVLCLSYDASGFWNNGHISQNLQLASRHSHFDLEASEVIEGHLVLEGKTLDINRKNRPSMLKEYIYRIPGDDHDKLAPLASVYHKDKMPEESVAKEIVTKLLMTVT